MDLSKPIDLNIHSANNIDEILAKLDESDADWEISKDFKSFALCIKEGVLNYEMLMAKYNNKWMRVECHQKYGDHIC